MIVKIALLCLLAGCVLNATSLNKVQNSAFLGRLSAGEEKLSVDVAQQGYVYLYIKGKGTLHVLVGESEGNLPNRNIVCDSKSAISVCVLRDEKAPINGHLSQTKLTITRPQDQTDRSEQPVAILLVRDTILLPMRKNVCIQPNHISHLKASVHPTKAQSSKLASSFLSVDISSKSQSSNGLANKAGHLAASLNGGSKQTQTSKAPLTVSHSLEYCHKKSCEVTVFLESNHHSHLEVTAYLSRGETEPAVRVKPGNLIKSRLTRLNSHLYEQSRKEKWTDIREYEERAKDKSKVKFQNLDKEIELKDLIGKGSFGTVYKCYDRRLKVNGVAKQIVKERILAMPDEGPETVRQEMRALVKLPDHPNVCKFYRAVETEDEVWIIMELCGQQTLYDYTMSDPIPERKLRKIMKQILLGQRALHKAGVYQLDVKLTNVMLINDEHAKIIDFNLAVISNEKIQMFVGADGYYSYEMIAGTAYTPSMVDTWGDGIMIFKGLSGEGPFGQQNTESLKKKTLSLKWSWPSSAADISPELRDLFDKVFQPEDKRLTVEQMLEHPWIKGA